MPERIVPPGQEDLVAEIAGRGVDLPSGCRWMGADVERTRIVSKYDCSSGRVTLELAAPEQGASGAERTTKFSIRTTEGGPALDLERAVAQRARDREAKFRWETPAPAQDGRSAAPPRPRGELFVAPGLFLAAALVVTVVLLRSRRGKAKQDAPPIERRRGLAFAAASIAGAITCCAGVHLVLRAFGNTARLGFERGAARTLAVSFVMAIVGTLVVLVGAFAIHRARHSWTSRRWIAIAAVVYLPFAYVALGPGDRPRGAPFGAIEAWPPNMTVKDHAQSRPEYEYTATARGFRAPDFTTTKAPGVTRIALIGDSYVFGMGVRDDETLSTLLAAEIARRGRRVEVLNLGIPGDNIASHVDALEAARDNFDVDVFVVCLTLVNDLSRWDEQTQRRDERRFSAFRVLSVAFGWNAAVAAFDAALLERETTPEGLAHLDAQLARVDALRAAAPKHPSVFLFAYGDRDPSIAEVLARHPGLPVVPCELPGPGDSLPNDGHPTGQGNRRYARCIADAIDAAR